MKLSFDMLSAAEYELLNKCIAWHIRPHRQVFLEGLAAISNTLCFDNLNVLELGATAFSTVSPFLVTRGANTIVTCYSHNELPKLNETVMRMAQQYNLSKERFQFMQADIFALDKNVKYDLIVLKDVLGGVNRNHNYSEFKRAVDNCLAILNSNGKLLIIDKAHSYNVVHWMLKKMGEAGRNNWHYFTFDELIQLIPEKSYKTSINAHGLVSFCNFGCEPVQKIADYLDEHFVERVIPLEKRAVFSLICQVN